MILKEWQHAGMTCALRHGAFDAPCGYVAVPKEHKLYRRPTCEVYDLVDIHGGVTWSNKLTKDEKNRWWIGFDMAHAGDFDEFDLTRCIRTDEECIAETNRLAEQLAKIGGE